MAVAEVDGPEAALALVDELPGLGGYCLWHAVRGHLLRRLGRIDEAARAYDEAMGRAHNAAEREFLRRARDELAPSDPSA